MSDVANIINGAVQCYQQHQNTNAINVAMVLVHVIDVFKFQCRQERETKNHCRSTIELMHSIYLDYELCVIFRQRVPHRRSKRDPTTCTYPLPDNSRLTGARSMLGNGAINEDTIPQHQVRVYYKKRTDLAHLYKST